MVREVDVSIVCISGGFDPLHVGHAALIEEASEWGDVVVILNSDSWLMRKKGYVFMPWSDRNEILKAMRHVGAVTYVDDSDGTVCEALERIKPDYFANGGDRTEDNTPEKEVCERLGIKMLWGIGGKKIASSSDLVRATHV